MLTRVLFWFWDLCVAITTAALDVLWPGRRRQLVLPKGEVAIAALIAKAIDGVTEYRLADQARVDILTAREAIEVDWAHKWAEGIGQALYYGAVMRKTPVVLLLMDTADEERYLVRVRKVISTYTNTRLKLWLFNLHTGQLDMGKNGLRQIT